MIVGIDPGVSGAIAILRDDGTFAAVHDMPTVEKKVAKRTQRRVDPVALHLLVGHLWEEQYGKDRRMAFVEQVWPRPQEGAVSSFSFGRGLGVIEGILAANGYECQWVNPVAWKRHFGLLKQEKDCSRLMAKGVWPEAPLARKKDNGRAEALLVGRYGLDTASMAAFIRKKG